MSMALSILPESELIFDTHSSSNCSSSGYCVDVLQNMLMLLSLDSAVFILYTDFECNQAGVDVLTSTYELFSFENAIHSWPM